MGKKVIFLHVRGINVRAEGMALKAFIPGEGPRHIPFAEIDELWIMPGVMISSEAILRTIESGGVVLFARLWGTPAIVIPGKFFPMPETKLSQLKARFNWRGLVLAKAFAYSSIHGRYLLLKYLARNRRKSNPEIAEKLDEQAEKVKTYEEILMQLQPDEEPDGVSDEALKKYSEKLRSVEGNAAREYYKGLQLIIPETLWPTRERKYNPPADPFNAMLSFANGILKGVVFRMILGAGLDPTIGFLHVTVRSGYRGLVYDLTEQFMATVSHEAAISLVSRGVVDKDWWVYVSENRVLLTDKGRRGVWGAVMSRLEQKVYYRGKRKPIRSVILGEARKLAKFLRGEVNKYEPYIPGWG